MTDAHANQFLVLLTDLIQILTRINTTMGQVATDIQALTAAVTANTAAINTAIADLANINTDNLTPSDQAALEGAVTALQSSNANLQAAVNPAPAPPAPPSGS